MEGTITYLLLGAAVVLLVVILIRQSRVRGTPSDQTLAALVESLKEVSAVQPQVNSLSNTQAAMMQSVVRLEVSLKDLEARMKEATGDVRASLSRDVADTRNLLVELRSKIEDRSRWENEIHAISRRIERVLVGARTRGESGENILSDAFAEFPPGMIDRDFRVGGKVVEYAIVLPSGKRLPVDSKWAGSDNIERIHEETDPDRVRRLESDIEREVKNRIREVATYIDPSCTSSIAIAAVPDSIYAFCRKVHVEGFRAGVLLMAYSMVVPYILALYHLHLQMGRSLDYENLEVYLTRMERNLDDIDRVLENKVAKAGTMATNAYGECKQILGSMRAAAVYLRGGNVPERDEVPQGPAPPSEQAEKSGRL
jgi:DNA anti-recombination protein RmuC